MGRTLEMPPKRDFPTWKEFLKAHGETEASVSVRRFNALQEKWYQLQETDDERRARLQPMTRGLAIALGQRTFSDKKDC